MTACLNCQKEVEPQKGKRAKKFCSDACRATHYQKHRPKGEPRYVLQSTHKKVVEELEVVRKELRELQDKVRWGTVPLGPPKEKTEDLVDPRLEEVFKKEPKPLPVSLTAAFKSYNELLAEAKLVTTREQREAFAKAVALHPKLTPGQKSMIHSKLPKLNP